MEEIRKIYYRKSLRKVFQKSWYKVQKNLKKCNIDNIKFFLYYRNNEKEIL